MRLRDRQSLVVGAVAVLGVSLFAAFAVMKRDHEHRETLYVFGTLVELVIRHPDAQTAREAAASAADLLKSLHVDWHAWRPGALGTLNQAITEGIHATVDARLVRVLEKGQRLACESEGLFEPAIGQIVALWGFHADGPERRDPPPAETVAALVKQAPRMSDLTIPGGRIHTANAAVQLDLGGFAKGAALDLAAAELKAQGVRNAVLNAGGDVNVLGQHSDRPWRVAIRDPFVWGAVAGISMRPDEVLYTSGNYERFFEHQGTRFAHIIDPRTGMPVRDIVSVSVLAKDGARADAAATALSVAGPTAWPRVAARMGVDKVLMITATGDLLATPAMRRRLAPVDGDFPAPVQVVSLPATSSTECAPGPSGALTTRGVTSVSAS